MMHVRATEIIVPILMPKITSNFFVGSLAIFFFAFKFNPKWIATKTKGKLFFIVSYTAELNSSKLTSSWLVGLVSFLKCKVCNALQNKQKSNTSKTNVCKFVRLHKKFLICTNSLSCNFWRALENMECWLYHLIVNHRNERYSEAKDLEHEYVQFKLCGAKQT